MSSAHYLVVLAHLGGSQLGAHALLRAPGSGVGLPDVIVLEARSKGWAERDTQLLGLLYPVEGRIGIVQWNLSIEDTPIEGHLSNEDTVCCPNHFELCTNLPLNKGHLSIQDSQLGPSGVPYREVPLYT